MSEKAFRLEQDGQSVLQEDFNQFGETAGLADDRVFAEILRMVPDTAGTIAKGVLPYDYNGASNPSLVVANGASGSVLVNPCRAFIGSRTLAATEAKENWRDIRSGISIADGAVALTQTVSLTANASGDPRWDAIYAVVAVDAAAATVLRKVKSPITSVVTDTSVSVTSQTLVTIASATGTAAATPAFPSIPADSGSTYYVLIAYVRVPTGFTAGSTVSPKDINEAATVLTQSRAMGTPAVRPANQSNIASGTAISGTGTSSANGVLKWNGTTAARPGVYIPPSMTGAETLLVAIDIGNASSANWSHQTGAIVDDSRDWRNRVFKWSVSIGRGSAANTSGTFPWNGTTDVSAVLTSGHAVISAPNVLSTNGTLAQQSGFGQSFSATSGVLAYVAELIGGTNVPNTVMANTTVAILYVDTATGALKLFVSGAPLVSLFFWLDATAPYGNAS